MNNTFLKLCIFIFALQATSCDIEVNNDLQVELNADISKLSWVSGTWIDTTTFGFSNPKKQFIEKWSLYPDSLSGVGLKVIGYDTTIQELMCIRKINNKLVYIARPKEKSMLSFNLDTLQSDMFCFVNKANDFPQNIEYKMLNNDSMAITLSGIFNEDIRGVRLRFKKL